MKSALLAAAAFVVAAAAHAQASPLTTAQTYVQANVQPPVAAAGAAKVQPVASGHRRTETLRLMRHRNRPPSVGEQRTRAATSAATLEPVAGNYLNAQQVYPFTEGAIFHVLAAPGQVTDIALQAGEVLGSVAAGDTVRWVIGDTTSGSGETRRTHILVKPFNAGLATNAVITTDRRTYHLALTSTGHTAMSGLSWTYPQDQLIALKRSAEKATPAEPVASGLAIDQLRFDYVLSGDKPSWRPLRVFDDGRQTFIEFPPNLAVGDAPPLFLVDAKGTASLVNYRVQGRYYVVDRLFDAAELRLGLKHQDIVRITRGSEPSKRRAS